MFTADASEVDRQLILDCEDSAYDVTSTHVVGPTNGLETPSAMSDYFSLTEESLDAAYEIVFDTDGGNYIEPIIAAPGTKITPPANPYKTGHTFEGWDREIPDVMPEEDIVILALWSVNTYRITFDTDGGTSVSPIVGEYGTKIHAPNPPSRDGYRFEGWSPALPTTMPEYDMVLTAIWSTTTITFDTDGGTPIDPISAPPGTKLSEPEAPTKEGYVFKGWDKPFPNEMPTYDMTLKAIWELETYTITYMVLGQIVEVRYLSFGDPIVQTYEPTREGYTFDGWGLPLTMPAHNLVVEAIWEPIKYTISFLPCHPGVSAPHSIVVTYDSVIECLPTITAEGTSFHGWFTEVIGGIQIENGSVMKFTSDISLYAHWGPQYRTIYFDTNGGYEICPISFAVGEPVIPPFPPTRDGHDFLGWDKPFPEFMPDEDLTLKALWQINTYTMTFYMEGGDPMEPLVLEYGSPLVLPSVPHRIGHTFIGWDIPIPDTIPGYDMEFHAQWSVNTYTITFDTDGGTPIASKSVSFGHRIYKINPPTKEGYVFVGWDKPIPEFMPDEDLAFTALWSVRILKITFNTVGGLPMDPLYIAYGMEVKVTDPVKVGHKFVGWDKEVPKTMPAEDITLTALWEVIKYTIVFETGKGSDVSSITQNYGTPVVRPQDPTLTGYSFMGWDRDLPATMPAEDITLTALWKANEYQVSFDTCDVDIDSPSPITVTYDGKFEGLPVISKTGTSFQGWFTEKEGGDFVANDTIVKITGPITLFAHWGPAQYRIVFDTDGGTPIDAIIGAEGMAIQQPSNPFKIGHTFLGWDTEIPKTMPAEDMVISAMWKINSYTITFYTTGGEPMDPITLEYNAKIVIPTPVRTGYTFLGWDVDVPGYMPASDLFLTANWVINHSTITFDTAGGDPIDPISQEFGTEVDIPTPNRTGYTFLGWDKEVPKTMPAENITLTALWEAIEYTITFDTDGGTPIEPITLQYMQPVTAPKDPTRAHYKFIGWDVPIPETMPDHDVTITAQWELKIYVVTFDTCGGTAIDPIKGAFGTPIDVPADPTRDGYLFAGWDITIPETMPDHDVTITAKWTPNQYTISFDTLCSDVPAPGQIVVVSGKTYGELPTVTRIGHKFLGWFTLPDGGSLVENGMEIVIRHDTTLYAHWEILQYTLTFDTLGGTPIEPIRLAYGSPIVIPEHPVRAGYIFNGWDMDIPGTMPARDLKITAIWKECDYTVHFDTCTTYVDNPESISVFTGDTFSNLPNVVWTNHVFIGWFTQRDGGEHITKDTFVLLKDDITLYAHWELETFLLTFFDYDGSIISTMFKLYGEAIEPPTISRTGYVFKGWDESVPSTMPDHDVELFAVWEAIKITIHFDTNSDSEVENPESIVVTYGQKYPELKVPEWKHQFAGWFTDRWNGKLITSDTVVTYLKDLTLYAHWNKNRGTLIFDTGDGERPRYIIRDVGEPLIEPELNPLDPRREGYVFVCWDKEIPKTMPAGETVITAIWEAIEYQVCLDVSGVDLPTPDSLTVKFGDKFPNLPELSCSPYRFLGWFTEEGGRGTMIDSGSTMNTAHDIVLYAHWSSLYTITFHGTDYPQITLNYGDVIVPPENPSRTGYTFLGWDKDIPSIMPDEDLHITAIWDPLKIKVHFSVRCSDAEYVAPIIVTYGEPWGHLPVPKHHHMTFVYWSLGSKDVITPYEIVTITSETTIYANWSNPPFLLKFDTGGGTEMGPISVPPRMLVEKPSNPYREGYIFAGWDTEFPFRMPYNDVEVTALWIPCSYIINFDTCMDDLPGPSPMLVTFSKTYAGLSNLTKPGYTFLGWFTEPEGGEPITEDSKVTILRDTTLYAHWEIETYTTSSMDGDTVLSHLTLKEGDPVLIPELPSETGHTFKKWDSDTPSTMPTNDLTVTTVWNPNCIS